VATYGTFVDNTTLKASELNNFFVSTTFTPVLRQSSSLPIQSNHYGVYFQVNKLVFCIIHALPTASGTPGQRIEFDLPVTAASSSVRVIGRGYFNDDSASRVYRLAVVQYSTTRAAFISEDANSLTAYLGTTGGPNTALANADAIGLNICYEAA
jgi:hypothetical protein